MRYSELSRLDELFSSKADWKIIRHNSNQYQYEFDINDITYEVDMMKMQHNIWGVSFNIKGDHQFKMTGTGNASLVLSTVMDIMQTFIKANDPNGVRFEASMSEPSRVSLYRRLSKSMAPMFNYEVYEEERNGDMFFFLTKKKEQE